MNNKINYNNLHIVIKIGSAIIIENNFENLLKSLIEDIIYLQKKYHIKIIIITSGAYAIGKDMIKFDNKDFSDSIKKKTAIAIGQIKLINKYHKLFTDKNIIISQILVTNEELDHRKKYLNLKESLKLMEINNIIPIINEHDFVSHKDNEIGDNDRLAARIAQITESNLLIVLSDIKGLYNKNPRKYEDAKLIKSVSNINQDIEEMAEDTNSILSKGGMYSKILAAKMAFRANCDVIIANGSEENILLKIINNQIDYTLFLSDKKKSINSRKKWLINSMNNNGEIIIDNGAKEAILKGKSLLIFGVKKIIGEFNQNDIVKIKDLSNNHIANGIISYDHILTKYMTKITKDEINKITNNKKKELIHRNNMAIINNH